MPLSDTRIRLVKPEAKPFKLTDERSLFLLVNPNGSKLWRFKYHIDGIDSHGRAAKVEKALALGSYPDVSLKRARQLRDEARELIAMGHDPAHERKKAKAASRISTENSFAKVANMLLEKQENEGLSHSTLRKRRWFIKLVYPMIGKRPIAEIEPIEILLALKPTEQKGRHESAKRALGFFGQVFRYAVAWQLAKSDPTRDLRGALTTPKVKHYGAVIDPEGAGALLRAIEGYQGQTVTRIAMLMSAHVFVRPGELRQAEWNEFDFTKQVWRIPASRMLECDQVRERVHWQFADRSPSECEASSLPQGPHRSACRVDRSDRPVRVSLRVRPTCDSHRYRENSGQI